MGKSEPPYNANVSGLAVAEVPAMADQPLVRLADQPYLDVASGLRNKPSR